MKLADAPFDPHAPDNNPEIYLPIRLADGYVREVCKVGQGAACCRYLAIGDKGWSCLKLDALKGIVDARAEAGTMVARSNNCAGRLT